MIKNQLIQYYFIILEVIIKRVICLYFSEKNLELTNPENYPEYCLKFRSD